MDETKTVVLGYDPETDLAPKILAKGIGAVGDYILNLARKSKVPIYKNEKLAEALFKLRENEEIPFELYTIVADIFAFVDSLQ